MYLYDVAHSFIRRARSVTCTCCAANHRFCALQVVKVYPDGKMSQHMHGLEVGDSLEIKGPISKLPYTPNMKEKIGMVSPAS